MQLVSLGSSKAYLNGVQPQSPHSSEAILPVIWMYALIVHTARKSLAGKCSRNRTTCRTAADGRMAGSVLCIIQEVTDLPEISCTVRPSATNRSSRISKVRGGAPAAAPARQAARRQSAVRARVACILAGLGRRDGGGRTGSRHCKRAASGEGVLGAPC